MIHNQWTRTKSRVSILVPVFAIAVALLPTGVGAQANPPTHPVVHPALFKLPPSSFPAGSQVVRAGVESNKLLRQDQPDHFGFPLLAMARLTGFFMESEDAVQAPASRGYTSYLVSIFASARAARWAFSARRQVWIRALSTPTPPAMHLGLGAHGREALFQTAAPDPYLAELLFQRGSILVEVSQGTDQGNPTELESRALIAIAHELGELAREHPLGE